MTLLYVAAGWLAVSLIAAPLLGRAIRKLGR